VDYGRTRPDELDERLKIHSGVPTCISPRFNGPRSRHLCVSASIAFARIGA
jgi:hypothetical protein